MATRADYRLGTMKLLGDVEELTATVGGTPSTFVDQLNLYKESGTLRGRMLYLTSGTNASLVRRVQSNDKDTYTLSLDSALPLATAAGDLAQLYNFRDQGVSIAMVHSAINHAIMYVREDYRVPVADAIAGTFAYDAPVLTLSSTIKAFAGVDIQSDEGEWIELPGYDTHVDQWARTLTLKGYTLGTADGRALRVRGFGYPTTLTNDSTDCPVDFEWLIQQAAANVLFELARKRLDPSVNERWAQFRQDLADERRVKVTQPNYGYSVPLYG